jgi:fused signal recognition particle receptor
MVDSIQNVYSLIDAVILAVDAEISLLVLGLGVLYCIVGVLSLKTKGVVRGSQEELESLRREVQKLSAEVCDLRAQVQARAAAPLLTTTPAPEVAAPPPFREVESRRQEEVASPQHQLVEDEKFVEVEKIVQPREERSSIARGMTKSRTSLLGKLKGLFTGGKNLELASLDDLEEMLITSDVGVRVAESLISSVRESVSGDRGVTESDLKQLLKEGIRKELISVPPDHRLYQPVGTPLVVLVVGVNGVGKTTTVAKLATRYMQQGKKVLAIAADTFRAAAVQQLNEWGNRSGFIVYSGAENAKPAAVVFDGMVSALQQGIDVVLIDTAGRLHTKSNLMQELEGVRNSIRRHVPDAPHETVLVVDGVSGQNALAQAREFNASTPLTGLVVTKLDGTPKGGIIVAISQELKIPVLYVGVGEKAQDLLPFSGDEFINGLLVEDGDVGGLNGVRGPSSLGDGVAVQM